MPQTATCLTHDVAFQGQPASQIPRSLTIVLSGALSVLNGGVGAGPEVAAVLSGLLTGVERVSVTQHCVTVTDYLLRLRLFECQVILLFVSRWLGRHPAPLFPDSLECTFCMPQTDMCRNT
jgi:hypothetical protein